MGDWASVEQLEFVVRKEDIDSFFIADANTWTPFLERQDGFAGRLQLVDASAFNNESISPSSNITITNLIIWNSFKAWKAIPAAELIQTQAEFEQQFGSGPPPTAIPTDDGWMIYNNDDSSSSSNLDGLKAQTPLGCMLSDSSLQQVCSMQGSSCDTSNEGAIIFYKSGFYFCIGVIFVLLMYVSYLHVKLKDNDKLESTNLMQKSCPSTP